MALTTKTIHKLKIDEDNKPKAPSEHMGFLSNDDLSFTSK